MEQETVEMDHGSVSDNTNSLHKLDPLHFQRPGSQYLGSDDSEGFRALVGKPLLWTAPV